MPSVTSPILHVLMTSVILATLWRSTEGLGIVLRVPFTWASRADLLLGFQAAGSQAWYQDPAPADGRTSPG